MFQFKELHRDKTGARAGIIKNKEVGDIPTPFRMLTSSEIGSAEKIMKSGLAVPRFPHKIIQIGWFIGENTLNALGSDTRVYHSQVNRIREYSKFPSKLSMLNPIFANGFAIQNKINDVLIDLQIDSDIELVTIQNEIGSSPSEYGKRLDQSREKMDNADGGLHVREPIPTLNLIEKEKLFSEKLKEIPNREFNAINLVYASPLSQWQNYSALIKFFEKNPNILIHFGNLPRTWPGSIRSSMPHVMQIIGDSFAVMPRKPIVPYRVVWKKVKIFDRKNLGNLTPEIYQELVGNNLDNCFVCEPVKNDIRIFGKTYQDANLLPHATKSHEAIASSKEMNKGRESIENGEFTEYVKSKRFLDLGLQRILRTNVRQQKFFNP